jgi:hypothetical protein
VQDIETGPSSSSIDASDPHILITGALTVIAPPHCLSCSLVIRSASSQSSVLDCSPAQVAHSAHITCLVLDQVAHSSHHHSRIAAFLSTGEFSTFTVDHTVPAASSRLQRYVPQISTSRTAPILQAAYHYPLLATLSKSFHLSLYDLSGPQPRLQHTLTSFTSYPPSSLVLSAPAPNSYKLVLAYAVPVYPAHWSVGATELQLTTNATGSIAIKGTRTARAFEVPPGWVDPTKLRTMREQWDRKLTHVADTQTDGKWVVLGPGTLRTSPATIREPTSAASGSTVASSMHSANALQLYRLHLPSSASGAPRLSFVRFLHGQTGPVTALALRDGRCVCLSANGSMWVWDLERGTGAEIACASYTTQEVSGGLAGAVVFDERQVVSAGAGGVQVRKFDI